MFSPQESGSGLASVIGSPDLGEWHSKMFVQWSSNLLPKDHLLALFHAKFWGKSMVEEEQEWRNAQRPTPAIGGELGGDGVERVDEDVDERMDEGERTELDDDIPPGCYVLDIGIPGLGFPKIWIRADYKRIYDALEGFYNQTAQEPGRAPSAVVTGQPGIGEC